MGGSPLNPEIKNLMIQIWTQMRNEGIEATATKVRTSIAKQIKGKERQFGRLPKLRTFQDVIGKAKNTTDSNPSIDEDWSMASLIIHDFPADSMPFIIKIWRYAIANHEKFTVMQAKWVARLYRIYESTTLLWYHSLWYSDIERVGILSGKNVVTHNSDGLNFLSGWETTNLLFTLYYYDHPRNDFAHQRIKESLRNGKVIEELLHYKNTKDNALFIYSPDTFKYVQKGDEMVSEINHDLSDLIRELPLLETLGLNEDIKMVYFRLYGVLIRGSKWNDLSPKEAVKLIVELRRWVLEKSEELKNDSLTVSFFDDGTPWPIEILSKVGYEIKADKPDYVSIDNPVFSGYLRRIM